ncbi:MAG: hypothetical protein GXO59_05690 [Dictyoglomi bacterium]|nr:hypothetical protein [Dictyoglomota bacterium]
MYDVDEKTISKRGKTLFTILAITRYLIGLVMAYWASKIFSTLGYYYRQGMGDNLSGIDCLQCPHLLKQSSIALIVFGIILIALWLLEKSQDYLPAGLIWILSGVYYLYPSMHSYKKIVLGIYLILFIWWIVARNKDVGRLLGHIQIFMPLSLAGVLFTDDITVWLFTIFLAIAFEGVYLAVQGASELAYAMLIGIEEQMTEEGAIWFLGRLLNILNIQKLILWSFIAVILIDGVASFTHHPILIQIKFYGYIILSILYLLTWVWIGVDLLKVHKALGISTILSIAILIISLVVKYITGNTFLAIIGILTGISILAQVGPIYEYFVRRYTSVIMFNVYVDHSSIVMLFVLLIISVYDPKATSIMVSVSPFFLITTGLIIKLFTVAFLLDTTARVITNIEYAFRPPEEGGYKKVGVE